MPIAIRMIPATISGIFVLKRLAEWRPISKPMTPMTKLAIAIADVAVIMFAFMNANEIPTAKASMLVATDNRRMFAMERFAALVVASSAFSWVAPQIMRKPKTQRIPQAIAVPTDSNQRSAKFPRKYPSKVMPPWKTPNEMAWSMARL